MSMNHQFVGNYNVRKAAIEATEKKRRAEIEARAARKIEIDDLVARAFWRVHDRRSQTTMAMAYDVADGLAYNGGEIYTKAVYALKRANMSNAAYIEACNAMLIPVGDGLPT